MKPSVIIYVHWVIDSNEEICQTLRVTCVHITMPEYFIVQLAIKESVKDALASKEDKQEENNSFQ